MIQMSKEDWGLFDEVMRLANSVLDSDLEGLRRMDEVKRIDHWNHIEQDQNRLDQEFASRLPRDIAMNSRSNFSFARLLLAAAAHVNGEESPIIERFNSTELALVENFERFNVFDISSTEELVERIDRRGDIYELVMEFYKGQYSDLDAILDNPRIEKDLKYAFKNRYKKRLDGVADAVVAYVRKYGPVKLAGQIEQKVLDNIKQSEEERRSIAESLRNRMADVASKLRSLDQVEREGDLFKDKLRDVERELLAGRDPGGLDALDSEKDRLGQSYLEFEREIAALIEATADKQGELAAREGELDKARQEYEQLSQEDKQRLVENELREIDSLKSELESDARSLEEERSSLQLKRSEMDDRLRQITETLEGKSIRFVTREDAKLCELNLIARFDTKMQSFPLKIDSPIERKTHEVKSWNQESHLRYTEGAAPDAPSNVRSRYIIGDRKFGFFGERVKKVVIEAVSLNHLHDFEEYGFDVRRANLSEFLNVVARFLDSAEIGKYLHVIGIASPTGWDERVARELSSTDFAHNYVSRFVSICLVDSVTGDVVHNPADERIARFVDFFRPEFDREKLERIKGIIMKGLSEKDYVVFEDVAEETMEERLLLNKAFHDLDADKKGRLRYIKDVGLVLEVVG